MVVWVITKDYINDLDRGRHSVSHIKINTNDIIRHPDGQKFRMTDDTGKLYYEGVYVGPDGGAMLAPLDGFGCVYGATQILYLKDGNWEPAPSQ